MHSRGGGIYGNPEAATTQTSNPKVLEKGGASEQGEWDLRLQKLQAPGDPHARERIIASTYPNHEQAAS